MAMVVCDGVATWSKTFLISSISIVIPLSKLRNTDEVSTTFTPWEQIYRPKPESKHAVNRTQMLVNYKSHVRYTQQL